MARLRHLLWVLLFVAAPAFGQTDSTAVDTLWRHNPYDLSQAAPVDSNDVYRSPTPNPILALPRYVWSALVYPIGRFTIFAEHANLVTRYFSFFTNADGTFGVFPQVQLGGETGSGGGAKMFATNLFGRGKILTGYYVYSGSRGQMSEATYIDPNLFGTGLIWRTDGLFLRTHHKGAGINAPFDDFDETRLFRLDAGDVTSTLRFKTNRGPLSPFQPAATLDIWGGYSRRDLRVFTGGSGPIAHPGSTPVAQAVHGLGEITTLYRVGGRVQYDDRDYKRPRDSVILPLNYKIPGRIAIFHEGLYYFMRDLGYPERGGLVLGEIEYYAGTDDHSFYRVGAELQRFFTLFWEDRILAVRARLDKVRGIDGDPVPYTELPAIGGGTSARGYRRDYFHGQGALLFNVEYRWPIWDTWNAFMFWDESQIFDHYADITSAGFTTSVGGGIAFRTEIGLIGKLQVAHSTTNNARISFVFGGEF